MREEEEEGERIKRERERERERGGRKATAAWVCGSQSQPLMMMFIWKLYTSTTRLSPSHPIQVCILTPNKSQPKTINPKPVMHK